MICHSDLFHKGLIDEKDGHESSCLKAVIHLKESIKTAKDVAMGYGYMRMVELWKGTIMADDSFMLHCAFF